MSNGTAGKEVKIVRPLHRAANSYVLEGMEGWKVKEKRRPFWLRWLRYTDLDTRLPLHLIIEGPQSKTELKIGFRHRLSSARWDGEKGGGKIRRAHWGKMNLLIQPDGEKALELVPENLGLSWRLVRRGEDTPLARLSLRFAGASAVLAEGRRYSWELLQDDFMESVPELDLRMLMTVLYLDRMRHS